MRHSESTWITAALLLVVLLAWNIDGFTPLTKQQHPRRTSSSSGRSTTTTRPSCASISSSSRRRQRRTGPSVQPSTIKPPLSPAPFPLHASTHYYCGGTAFSVNKRSSWYSFFTTSSSVPPGDSDDSSSSDDEFLSGNSAAAEEQHNATLALLAEAEQLRQRARRLKVEAAALELELQVAQSRQSHRRATDVAVWTRQLFVPSSSEQQQPQQQPSRQRTTTPESVAQVLRRERFTEEQVVQLWQDLYRRRHEASGVPAHLIPTATTTTTTTAASPSSTTAAAAATDADDKDTLKSNQALVNQTEVELLTQYMEILLNATAILDEETNTLDTTNNITMIDSGTGNAPPQQPPLPDNRNRRWSGRVYSQLKTLQKEWDKTAQMNFQRRIAANVQAALKSNLTVTEYVRRSLGLRPVATAATAAATTKTNDDATAAAVNATAAADTGSTTSTSEPASLVPLWIPPSLLPFVLASQSRLNVVDVRAIKERVLPKTRFFCTSSESTPGAAVFRGNMRDNAVRTATPTAAADQRNFPAAVFGEIQSELDRAGLAGRIQLFLLPDPEWVPDRGAAAAARGDDSAEPSRPKPVLVALPRDVTPDDSGVRQSLSTSVVKKASLVLGLAAALAYSVSRYALNPRAFDAVVQQQKLSPVLGLCLPMFLGVLAVQGVHEAAHRWVARKRGMKIGLPLLIPSVQVGTFGCITPLRSFPPNRSALLDFALSGPVSAMMLSVLFMMVGCYKTVYASQAKLALYPVVSVALLKSSFLSGSMLTFLLPKAMMLPLSQPIPIHPLFMVGFSGMLSSALNLLPIFRLDGGRACSAAMGSRICALTSAWTLLSMLSMGLSGSELAWTWGAFVLFFQRRPELPARDEVTAVNDARLGAWIASLVAAVSALLPFPGGPGFL